VPTTHRDAGALMAMIGVVVGEFITAQAMLRCMIIFASSAGGTAARRNRCDLPIHTTPTFAAWPGAAMVKKFYRM
jgi:hypothetical protein